MDRYFAVVEVMHKGDPEGSEATQDLVDQIRFTGDDVEFEEWLDEEGYRVLKEHDLFEHWHRDMSTEKGDITQVLAEGRSFHHATVRAFMTAAALLVRTYDHNTFHSHQEV